MPAGRPTLVLLLIAALVGTGCVTTGVQPASTDAKPTLEPLTDAAYSLGKLVKLTVTSFDGTPIHVDVALPNGSGPFPTIITYTPYSILGQQAEWAQADLGLKDPATSQWLKWGYAVGTAHVRGTGESGGCLTVGGPEEGKDGYAMVESLAKQPWSNGKIALMGTSWDGTTPLETAVLQPPHLAAIVSMSPVTEWYRYYFELGAHRRNADPFPGSSDTDPFFDAVLGGTPGFRTGTLEPTKLRCQAEFLAEDDAQDDYDAFWHARDHHANARNITVPVLYAQGWEDGNVAPTGIPSLLANLTNAADVHAWLEQHGHGVPASKKGYWEYAHRFLDHYTLGKQNGAEILPRVIIEDNTGKFRSESSWPPANLTTTKLYLATSGKLAATPGSGMLSYRDTATGRVDDALDGVDHLVLVSDALPTALHVAGVPQLHAKVTSDTPGGQLDVLVYDRGDGKDTLVTRGFLDLRHRESLDHAKDMPQGSAVEIAFDLHPNDHIVAAGHKLVLVVKSTDDYVVRSPYRPAITLTLGEGTVLDLPVENVATGTDQPVAPWTG